MCKTILCNDKVVHITRFTATNAKGIGFENEVMQMSISIIKIMTLSDFDTQP